ncbi:hypothetical protein [Tropicimonas sediminicola]|uniref:Uncharacterized protein n=1 Tax=Tropicimonas sediminicola TaxID=1031541 RepID=A0A239D2W9_9RHOB|nr:hypothetical protein [Tropicimonas sediminicola]SNS26690.1 hypothetical protein SAMN05421757_101617 [Tropicimonas sediminicola]
MSSATSARDLIYNNIDRIMANAQRLRAEETVSLVQLLTPDFMTAFTSLPSVAAMFALAGEARVDEAALARIPDAEWERIVRETTAFSSWAEMFEAASQAWVRGRLLDGCEGAEARP